jgi:CheY-like chemotaxis protein
VASIGERIDTIRPVLMSTMGASATLLSEIPADTWPVKIDTSELELALLNMVLNARDALPTGGTITIAARNLRLGPGDTPEPLDGEFVALGVADTGTGIAPDILPKVFDPFFTTKEVNKGTGLGLSQVHGLAHQSGGTVTIESQLGVGTTVTLYLPRALGMQAPAALESVLEVGGGGRVLLVEDNPDVAEVSCELLSQLGYEVHAASDPARALDILAGNQIDLVVSDIVMAGPMDGLGLARAIRERDPDLPIILVTGYADSAARAAAEFTVLRKPYQPSELSRAAANALATRRAGVHG